MSRIKLLFEVVNHLESLSASLRTLAEAMTENQSQESIVSPAPEVTPSVKPITMEEVRAVLTPISQSGKTAQVKELLLKYGVNRLSELDASHYEALIAEARDLTHG